jgi:hypothetical protein
LLYYIPRQGLVKTIIERLHLPALEDPLIAGIFHRSGRRVSAVRLRLPYVPNSVAAQMDTEPPYFEPALEPVKK